MARRTPYVADGVLHVPGLRSGPEVLVDSTSWVAWLTDPATHSFSFQNPSGKYTARKEHRSRGGEYWVAYRKRGGKLHKAYLGKAEDLTLTRLQDIAATMADRGGEFTGNPPPDPTAGDGGSSRRADATSVGPAATNDRAWVRSRQGIERVRSNGFG